MFVIFSISFNTIFHVINTIQLYEQTKKTFSDNFYAFNVAKYFAITPSLLYHINFYSETQFFFMTNVSLHGLLYILETQKNSLQIFFIIVLGVLSSPIVYVRSLGVLQSGFQCYPLLLILQTSLKKFKTVLLSFFGILTIAFFMLQPILHITFYTADIYCKGFVGKENLPEFCLKNPPFFYGYIQKEYWNVQFLNWVKDLNQAPQLICIILSFTALIYWNLRYIQKFGLRNIFQLHVEDYAKGKVSLMSQQVVLMPYFCLNCFLLLISFFYTNLVSVQRFMSVNPVFYFALADWFSFQQDKVDSTKSSCGKDKQILWDSIKKLYEGLYIASLTIFVGFNVINYQPC